MEPVIERPALTAPIGNGLQAIADWARSAMLTLMATFQQYGYRLNRTLPKDGSERMTGPLPLATYTTATLPEASDHAGSIIYVSDGDPGAKLRYSDGTNWIGAG